MTSAGKLLDQMRGTPHGWRIEDIAAACRAEGITCTPPRKGSHFKVKHADLPTIPAHRPIKPVYIRDFV